MWLPVRLTCAAFGMVRPAGIGNVADPDSRSIVASTAALTGYPSSPIHVRRANGKSESLRRPSAAENVETPDRTSTAQAAFVAGGGAMVTSGARVVSPSAQYRARVGLTSITDRSKNNG